MSAKDNRLVWFDIPVADLERASNFYRAVLAVKVQKEQGPGFSISVLEHHDSVGGCLVPNNAEIASNGGILVYLNVDGRIHDAVKQAEKHGGKLVKAIHAIGPHGFRAIVLDSEGNRVALHSNRDV
jgi:uncharacterized protein